MENGVILKIVFKKNCLSYDILKWFIALDLIDFKNIRYKKGNKPAKEIVYSKEKFDMILIDLLKNEDRFIFEAYDNQYDFCLPKKDNSFLLSISFNGEIFIKNKTKLFKFIDDIFNNDFGYVAFICHNDDITWQNINDLDYIKAKNQPYEHLKLIPHPYFSGQMIVDIEQNPGHSHMVNDLWFGSCWAMWFGNDYYQYIPENLIASFKDGYENIQLDSGARRVLLYEDIFSFDKPENRIIQKKFRDITGMDVVAHDLMNRPPENIDPTIEILNGHFENGGTKMMKRYLNNENEIIEKSKAVKVEIREIEVIENRWKTISINVVDI
ncbi:hypothetical protein [Acetivibrio clariflavus]|uniref:Uncharacterized protein n=1 Tax=Acetivibrio clariflavus (strain DSM 19732 / NBRC 101661 / EBR45) TaxID=720554 RepID=G8M2Y1_ACECE|nr:hypothetical protein [Acetivibrio clariflavus]AEV68245.1 hypothetical protein Clocl_1615 [Acetivibrio clariflavus DSM 19732]